MADMSDVESALVDMATAALYPLGSTAASVIGSAVRLYRGWPANAALETDLSIGIQHVTVTGVSGGGAAIDQFASAWEYAATVAPLLSAAVQGGTVTFTGDGVPGQLAGILVDNDAFAYRTRAGDTAELVAASLAALISKVRYATSAGATATVPGARQLIARVVSDQTALLQTRRQRAEFRLTCWCADPSARDATAGAIDTMIAQTPFLGLADGSVGRLMYCRSESSDELSTLPLYKRALTVSVDYSTTMTQVQPAMLFGIFSTGSVGGTPVLHLS